ncbi:MAG: GFA family protein [Alphaproteobacteria bacterium]
MRFLVAAAPMLTEFCHCESCRRSVGTPVMTWARFARDAVTITQGEPVAYESSPSVIRTFCVNCGTSLTLGDERFTSEIYVATAAFDDPGATEAIAPEVHIWRSERLPWVETTDNLPRYRGFVSEGVRDD